MSRRIHLAATVGLQGQIGLGGTVPWVHDPAINALVEQANRQLIEWVNNKFWITGWKTLDSLSMFKASAGLTAQIGVYGEEADPHEFLERVAEIAPDTDIWIMGGGKTYEHFMPFVDCHHITVVPYDGPADTYMPPLIPGWAIEGEAVHRAARLN